MKLSSKVDIERYMTGLTLLFKGALGVVTLKNLLEAGFDATGFDRNDYLGGLWKYRDDDQTSVLECKSCHEPGLCVASREGGSLG